MPSTGQFLTLPFLKVSSSTTLFQFEHLNQVNMLRQLPPNLGGSLFIELTEITQNFIVILLVVAITADLL
jgi:hypothetical protein